MSEEILWLAMILPILPVVIGLVIFIAVQRHRQKAAQQLSEFAGDSFVIVTKVMIGSADLADNVYIRAVNGQPVQRVVLSLGVAGYYLPVGQQVLDVAVYFGEGSVKNLKIHRRDGLKLTVTVEKGVNYHLTYHVPSGQLIFEPYDNPRIFKPAKGGAFF